MKKSDANFNLTCIPVHIRMYVLYIYSSRKRRLHWNIVFIIYETK